MEQTVPRFKAGQIVVMKGLKKQLPFRIIEAFWSDEGGGWFYRWDRRNSAAEHMIREVTLEEIGATTQGTPEGAK